MVMKETRIRWHNLGTTAKQVAMVWACAAKKRQWLGEEMYGVWSGRCQAKPWGRPKKTWKDIVEKDCQARKLNREDAMDRNRWRKQIRDDRWPWWVLVGECFFWYWLTWVVLYWVQRAVKRLCVCVFLLSWIAVDLPSVNMLHDACLSVLLADFLVNNDACTSVCVQLRDCCVWCWQMPLLLLLLILCLMKPRSQLMLTTSKISLLH